MYWAQRRCEQVCVSACRLRLIFGLVAVLSNQRECRQGWKRLCGFYSLAAVGSDVGHAERVAGVLPLVGKQPEAEIPRTGQVCGVHVACVPWAALQVSQHYAFTASVLSMPCRWQKWSTGEHAYACAGALWGSVWFEESRVAMLVLCCHATMPYTLCV